MSASVDIYTDSAKDVMSVPIQAVTAREKDDEKKSDSENSKAEFKEVVFVQSADTVMMKEVKTGIQDDEYIQILSGLDMEETIIKGPYAAISSKLDEGEQVYEKEEEGEEN